MSKIPPFNFTVLPIVSDLPCIDYRDRDSIIDQEGLVIVCMLILLMSMVPVFIRRSSMFSTDISKSRFYLYPLLMILILTGALIVGIFRRGFSMRVPMKPVKPYIGSSPDSFTVLFASDPQIPWGKGGSDDMEEDLMIRLGVETNRYHTMSMNYLKSGLVPEIGIPLAVIINGDLTAFGKEWQFNLYKQLYLDGESSSFPEALKMDIYPGLGNHDYDNNVGNCWGSWETLFTTRSNWCAFNSISYIEQFVAINFDKLDSYHPPSRSYSWIMYDVCFIQLHLGPSYYNDATGIGQSYDWMVRQILLATSKEQGIVINVHNNGYLNITGRFAQILKELPIEANILGVFAGHNHLTGCYSKNISTGRELNVYICGGGMINKYLAVKFGKAHVVPQIFIIDSEDGIPRYRNMTRCLPS